MTAFAAALGDSNDALFDTRNLEGIVAHPLFPMCVEWNALVDSGIPGHEHLDPGEARSDVHSAHDLTLHRLIRPGDVLTIRARVAAIETKPSGARQLLEIEGRDRDGQLVWASWQWNMFLGVGVKGPDAVAPGSPPSAPLSVDLTEPTPIRRETAIAIPKSFAYTYTECARIWNPIHTDPAVAAAAGLGDIILHGSATFAVAVQNILTVEGGGDPHQMRRARARFAAMVYLPSEFHLIVHEPVTNHDTTCYLYEVLLPDGGSAIAGGAVTLSSQSHREEGPAE